MHSILAKDFQRKKRKTHEPITNKMKSTKVQNPRCVYKPKMRVYWPRIAVQLHFPGQYLLLRRLAAACIGWGKAEPAIRPSRTILHDALNRQNDYMAVVIAQSV